MGPAVVGKLVKQELQILPRANDSHVQHPDVIDMWPSSSQKKRKRKKRPRAERLTSRGVLLGGVLFRALQILYRRRLTKQTA